ncbi:MAG TPA: NAD-dependent epimerase/dehydratase family protein [Thermoplasmata archaeon]|nr:NAD-dependent epimerase/dehydratase family protein [Thermoplasmata archaeon]
MDRKRVLITGGAGFIGSHLVDRLGARNDVTILDDLSTGSLQKLAGAPRTIHLKKASILDTDILRKAMEGQDVVYHLAAKTSVPESVEKPQEYWRTNVEGTVHVLRAAAEAGVRRAVFVSSAAVYGMSPEVPKVETMRPAPGSPYGMTKMVGEFACEEIHELKGLETVVLRLFNVYGPRQDPTSAYAGVIPKFCAAAVKGRPIEVYGDGEQTRDFLYVGDAAEGLELAAERPVAGQTLNLGSGISTTVNEVVRVLSEITGVQPKVVRKPERAGDIRDSLADVTRAKAGLGFSARTSVRDGIRRTLEAIRAPVKRSR